MVELTRQVVHNRPLKTVELRRALDAALNELEAKRAAKREAMRRYRAKIKNTGEADA